MNLTLFRISTIGNVARVLVDKLVQAEMATRQIAAAEEAARIDAFLTMKQMEAIDRTTSVPLFSGN